MICYGAYWVNYVKVKKKSDSIVSLLKSTNFRLKTYEILVISFIKP